MLNKHISSSSLLHNIIVIHDELIAKLARSGYGCRISQHFVGALSYADDITLLSPSLQGMQYMVNICEE